MESSSSRPGASVSGVFTRASSGLVREVSAFDAAYYGIMAITYAYMIFIIAALPAYPGASLEWAFIIMIPGAIALGIVYALFAAVYPRSGGDYVFISRAVHPLVGFVISFANAVWYSFYYGVNAAFFSIFGLSPMFVALGLQTGNSALTNIGTFFASGWGIFVGGGVILLLISLMMVRGVKAYFIFQRWGGTLALLSTVLMVVVLFLSGTGVLNFQANFDSLAGAGAYNKVIADAAANGAPLNQPASLIPTLNFLVWPAFTLFFSVNMVAFSGEIKNVRRSEMIGITSSMLISAVAIVLLMIAGRSGVGDKFITAAYSVPPGKFPLPIPPYLNLLASIAANNVILTVLLNLWVICMIPYAMGSNILYGSRAVLAWSIDGLAPDGLSKVSDRFHTPIRTIAVVTIFGAISLAVYAFTTYVAVLSGLIGFAVGFAVVCLTAVFFPYVRKEIFEKSPAALRYGGVPLMTLAAIIALPFLAWVIYRVAVDTAYGANTGLSVAINVAVFVVALVVFLGARAYRRSRGVDVDRRFREIPIE